MLRISGKAVPLHRDFFIVLDLRLIFRCGSLGNGPHLFLYVWVCVSKVWRRGSMEVRKSRGAEE